MWSEMLSSFANANGSGRKILETAAGSFGVWIVGTTFTFLVGVQLARQLGPAGYGTYGTVMALISFLLVPAQFGLPQLATREVAAGLAGGRLAVVKGVISWFPWVVGGNSLLIVLIGLTVAVVFSLGQNGGTSLAFLYGLTLVPLFALVNLLNGVLRGMHRTVLAQFLDALARPALYSASLYAMVQWSDGLDPGSALVVQAGTAVFVLLLCAIAIHKVLPEPVRRSGKVVVARAWLRDAFPMALTEVFRTADGIFGVLLLGLVANAEDVGLFRVALSSALFVGLPMTIVNLVTMPWIAKFHAERDFVRLQRLLASASVAASVITIALTLVILIAGQPLIRLVFGADYLEAWAPLIILCLACCANASLGATAALLNMASEARVVTTSFATSLAIAVPVSIILCEYFGSIGAAVGMLVSTLIRDVQMRHTALLRIGVDPSLVSFLFSTGTNKHVPPNTA